MVVVRSCCCGCTLAQGTIGSGIVSFIESILVIAYGAVVINNSNVREAEGFSRGVGYAAVVQGLLIFVVTILLFCAIKAKRRSLLLPWIVVRGILLGFAILGCIVFFASGHIIAALVGVTWNSLLIYLFLVVVSYYQTDMEQISPAGTVLAPGPVFATVPQQPGQQYVVHIPNTNVNSTWPFSNPIMGGPQAKPLATPGYVLAPSPQGYQPPPGSYAQPPPGSYAQPPPGSYAQPPPGSYAQPPPYPTIVYTDEPNK